MKVRSAADSVEKTTGLLKVTVMALGVMVTVEPLAGLVVDAPASRSTALIALIGVDQAVAVERRSTCRRLAVHRRGADSSSPARISAGVSEGTLSQHERGHGRRVGRGRRCAEERGQILLVRRHEVGRGRRARREPAERWCWPGSPGSKNDVLPPSGAVTVGSRPPPAMRAARRRR